MIPAPVLLAELSRRLNYDRSSGKLTRKAGFTGVVAGSALGTPDSSGNLQAMFCGQRFMVSHLVWLLETGELPAHPLWHVNGNQADCRIDNLGPAPGANLMVQCQHHGDVVVSASRKKKRGLTCPRCGIERGLAKTLATKKTPEAKAETRRAKDARAYQRDPERRRQLVSESAKRNRPKWRQDPEWRVRNALHAMVTRVAKDVQAERSKSHRASLGYTTAEFKAHIEQQFEPWMTWTNHGEWHIDHIVPVLWFVEQGITDPAVVNALTNLRPLSRQANLCRPKRPSADALRLVPQPLAMPAP